MLVTSISKITKINKILLTEYSNRSSFTILITQEKLSHIQYDNILIDKDTHEVNIYMKLRHC